MKCESCDSEDAEETICPYNEDVHGEIVPQ